MDNAIRFDGTKMLQNGKDAWSTDQESVDLNAYLSLEYTLLKKFAGLLGEPFDLPDYRGLVADYFFDQKDGFFYDRRLDADRSFVREAGCEGYIPFWANIATPKQFAKARKLLDNKKKFSTFIPFPTIAADNTIRRVTGAVLSGSTRPIMASRAIATMVRRRRQMPIPTRCSATCRAFRQVPQSMRIMTRIPASLCRLPTSAGVPLA